MVISKSTDERKSVQHIVATIRGAEKELRISHPFLAHQDAIGLTILAGSIVGMVATTALYVAGLLPALAVILINTVLASLTHELEHDLIHKMYFKTNAFMHSVMMIGVWLARPNTVNPWLRRDMHLWHHSTSGTPADIEERILGNGMLSSPLRLLANMDGTMSGLFQWRQFRKVEGNKFTTGRLLLNGVPLLFVHNAVWYGWLGVTITRHFIANPALDTAAALLHVPMVAWIGPNVVRYTALTFTSSNIHYYADKPTEVAIDSRLKQCQVLNSKMFWPVHALCCNFGSTHGIHHFVPKQPFYIRQGVAGAAHESMKKGGVLFNDWGSFVRSNRYPKESKKSE